MNPDTTKPGKKGRPAARRTAKDVRADAAAYGRIMGAIARYVKARKRYDRTFEPDGDPTIEGTTKDGGIQLVWMRGTVRSNEPYRVTAMPAELADPERAFSSLPQEQKAEIAKLRTLYRKYPGIDLNDEGEEEDEECGTGCDCEECCADEDEDDDY